MKTFISILSLGLLFICIAATTIQAQSYATSLDPMVERGVPPFAPMDGTRENINLGNGNLNITIPLLHLKGRGGMDLDLQYQKDTKLYQYSDPDEGDGGWSGPEWDWDSEVPGFASGRLTLPSLVFLWVPPPNGSLNGVTCQESPRFTAPDGRVAGFSGMIAGCVDSYGVASVYGQGGTAYSRPAAVNGIQGPGLDAYMDLTDVYHPIVTLEDGTRYYFTTSPADTLFSLLPTKIVDRNGNVISFANTRSQDSMLPDHTEITDTVGRKILISWANDTISWTDEDGNAQQITGGGMLLAQKGPQATFGMHNCNIGDTGYVFALDRLISTDLFNVYRQTLTIPTDTNRANDRVYSIDYDVEQEVLRVGYPSGGWTEYAYTTTSTYDPTLACSSVDVRQVNEKTTYDGNGNSETTSYHPILGTLAGEIYENSSNEVLYESGKHDYHTFALATVGAYDADIVTRDDNRGLQISEVIYDPSAYAPTTKRTVLTDGLIVSHHQFPTSTQTFEYANVTHGSPLVKKETIQDFDGAVLKVIESTYPGGATWPELLTAQTISDSHGSFKTTYGYDGASPAATGAMQHDTGRNVGNITSISRWNGNTPYTTTLEYDDTGNVTKITDPLGNWQRAVYSDSGTFESPAKCPVPSGQSRFSSPNSLINSKNQTTFFTFYSCTGQVASVLDPNGATTLLSYDALGRIIKKTNPDGGTATTTYHDPSPTWMSVTTTTSPTSSLFFKKNFDGLTREISSQLGADNDPATRYTSISYDDTGTPWLETEGNPSTIGMRGHYRAFDALGRVIEDDDELESIRTYSYSQNRTTITDERGDMYARDTDALGRLTGLPGLICTSCNHWNWIQGAGYGKETAYS
ncbi:MAG: hypothetical protein PW792_10445 [Acidobacteriaceae bacterium]|nr:hypothetical protein [Acidobacteriaceae bacterium]